MEQQKQKHKFKIGWFETKFYICTENEPETLYLHPDCKLYDVCGARGFYETRSDAEKQIRMFLGATKNPEILPESLFEI